MDYTTFKQAIADAERFIQETDAENFTSVDNIIAMCYLDLRLKQSAPTATVAIPTATQDVPEWFTQTLSQMPESRVTSSMVFQAASQKPSMLQLRMAGTWLRSLYGEPKRSNGQILFTITDKEDEQPQEERKTFTTSTLPLESRVGTYVATTHEPFTIDRMLSDLDIENTPETAGKAHRLLAVTYKMTEDNNNRFRKVR